MKIITITAIKCFYKSFHVNNVKLVCYFRIDVSENIDVNKTSSSKERIFSHYWYFLDKGFKFPLLSVNGVMMYL